MGGRGTIVGEAARFRDESSSVIGVQTFWERWPFC
jgi:hypothetical protein